MTPSKFGTARPPLAAGHRSFWLKQLHRWPWISSAICLIGMLLFAATGITLTHAGQIEASPRTTARTATMPAALWEALPPTPGRSTQNDVNRALPGSVRDWISREFGVTAGDREAEWPADEIYLPLPRPGGDGRINIGRESGALFVTRGESGIAEHMSPAFAAMLD
jgi:hypothetical protein